MSNPAAPVFVGIFIGLFFLIKYWKLVLLLLTTLVITALLVGAYQLVTVVGGPATAVVVEGQLDH